VAELLDESLAEEKNADEKLSEVAETCVNMEAMSADDEDAGESDDRSDRSARSTGNGARARSTRGRR
jgi:hypothetical protein